MSPKDPIAMTTTEVRPNEYDWLRSLYGCLRLFIFNSMAIAVWAYASTAVVPSIVRNRKSINSKQDAQSSRCIFLTSLARPWHMWLSRFSARGLMEIGMAITYAGNGWDLHGLSVQLDCVSNLSEPLIHLKIQGVFLRLFPFYYTFSHKSSSDRQNLPRQSANRWRYFQPFRQNYRHISTTQRLMCYNASSFSKTFDIQQHRLNSGNWIVSSVKGFAYGR